MIAANRWSAYGMLQLAHSLYTMSHTASLQGMYDMCFKDICRTPILGMPAIGVKQQIENVAL